jgi:hypothetical protein
MPYGTLALDAIESSGNLSLAGNLTVTGELRSTGRLNVPNTMIRIYQAVKTDTFTTASTSYANITGLLITVTPSNANSKFLLISDLSIGPNPGAGAFAQRFARDGNAITAYTGDAAGSRPRAMASGYTGDTAGAAGYMGITKMYMDSPATAANVTYTIQVAGSTTSPGFINRAQRDNDGANFDARTASSFTIFEIGG